MTSALKLDSKLAALGFVTADATVQHRVIISVAGMDKEGKTHFSLTSTPPIAYFSIDIGEEGVLSKFASSKTIYPNDFHVPLEKKDAEKEWERFNRAYHASLESKQIRSIVIDTWTEIWELARMAEFGKVDQVMPYMYGPINRQMRQLIRSAFKHKGTNLILLQKMRPVYINDKRTKDYEPAGFNDTKYLVQANLQVWREESVDGGKAPFHLYIRNCRQNPDLAGMDLEGEMCNFPMFASLAIDGTTLDDWE